MAFFLETLIGGLMTGMLYSLVALGFVLIFKASGVFNFAQGAMVLFAALAMARFCRVDPAVDGPRQQGARINLLAFVVAMAVMIVLAWLIERLVLGKLVNQEGITLLMATLGITYFLDGFGQTLFGSDIYKIDIGLPKDPIFLFDTVFQGGILVNKEDLYAAVIAAALVAAAGAVLPVHRPPAARCARWPTTTRPRSPSASRSTASGSSSGAWPASWRWWPASSGAASWACSSRCRWWR
jgi:branched-chain amino acid transport system permease protein